jgi:hypothetical protein
MAHTKNMTSPAAAARPIAGTQRPTISPTVPSVLRVPIGKVNHDSGTPAFSIPAMIGEK